MKNERSYPLPTRHELQEALKFLIKVGKIRCIVLSSNRILHTNLSRGQRAHQRKVIGTIFFNIAAPNEDFLYSFGITNSNLPQKTAVKHEQFSYSKKRERKQPIKYCFLKDVIKDAINVMYATEIQSNANMKSTTQTRDENVCNVKMLSPKQVVKGMKQTMKEKVQRGKKDGGNTTKTQGNSDRPEGGATTGAVSPDKKSKSVFQNIKEKAGSVPMLKKKKKNEDQQAGKNKGKSFLKGKIGAVTEKLGKKQGKNENKTTQGEAGTGGSTQGNTKKSFFQNMKEKAGSVPNILKKKSSADGQTGKSKGVSFLKGKIGAVTGKLGKKQSKEGNKNTKGQGGIKSLAGKLLNVTTPGKKPVEANKAPQSSNDKASDSAKESDPKNKTKNDEAQPKPLFITQDPTEDKSEEEETPPLFTYDYAQPWTMPLGSGCACHGCPHFPGHHKRPDTSSTSRDSSASLGWYSRKKRRKHRKRKHFKGDRISDSSVSTFTFSNPNSYVEDLFHDLATTLLHKQEIHRLVSKEIEPIRYRVHNH